MKCFLITMLFFGFAIVAYSQTTYPLPKGLQGYKYFQNPPASSKSYIINSDFGGSSKNPTAISIPCQRPDMSIISIIPTLRLWMLPVNIPNPFMKDEN